MTGRRNHPRTNDELLAEYRMREQIERGEKIVGAEAEWLDRRGPAAAAGRHREANSRHSHVRQQ